MLKRFKHWKRLWRIKSQLIEDINFYSKEKKEWLALIDQSRQTYKDLNSKNSNLYRLICQKIDILCKIGSANEI